jgi:hypothetical protein
VNAIANNIILILLKCMAKYRGASIEELAWQWVCIGFDGKYVF